jgi:hypothetical protein
VPRRMFQEILSLIARLRRLGSESWHSSGAPPAAVARPGA